MGLNEEIKQKKAELAQLEQRAKIASCEEVGHNWVFVGARACGCNDEGECSLPVYECKKCGLCDYGDNIEADAMRKHCAELE